MTSVLLIIILTIVVVVEGNQRTVQVSKLFSDDEDLSTNVTFSITIIESDVSLFCCVYGNCSCHSLDHALANLTSNVLINITTDMILLSHIKASNIENVSIIGHNNPTVNCQNVGGIHFNFCHNCIIQGITLDGCGAENINTKVKPVLKFSYSSNITIQNCSFQHSTGQAVVLSQVLGDANINHCNFAYNSRYRGHGAALYYSSYASKHSSLVFTINNCNFTHNKHAKSYIYINKRSNEYNYVNLSNSIFLSNRGIAIFVLNHRFCLNGKNLFQNNRARNGAGIYIRDHSTIVLGEHSNVAFIQNSADNNGAAVFMTNHSNMLVDQNSKITFSNNHATNGIIYSGDNSNIKFMATCEVIFNNNSATKHGTAIYSITYSHVIFMGNSKVTFSSNIYISAANGSVYNLRYGGAINSGDHSHISFKGNSSVMFTNNTAYDGGAINTYNKSHISFGENSSTWFISNKALYGGAICNNYITVKSYIHFEGNSSTVFSDNIADYGGGGAMFFNGNISFKGNSSVMFTNNIASVGGAINTYYNSHISFGENSSTWFISNKALSGGAIHISNYYNITVKSYMYFEGNSETVFSDNIADDSGGAIFSYSDISFKENSSTVFNNNIANNDGGTIYSSSDSYLSFKGSSYTDFNNNTASNGGALLSINHILFQENSKTIFNNNIADDDGGAVLTKNSISFEENCTATFSNNIAGNDGGAIFTIWGDVHFEGNSKSIFTDNTAGDGGGAIHCTDKSSKYIFSIPGHSLPSGYNAGIHLYCNITLSNNSTVTFNKSKTRVGMMMYSTGRIIKKENSTVIIDNLPAKWCNNTCLSFTDVHSDIVTVDDDGMVWCSNQEAFLCLTKECYCKNFGDLFDRGTFHNDIVNITSNVMILHSVVKLDYWNKTSIIGYNNLTVICVAGGRLILHRGNIRIEGITWIGCGGYDLNLTPVILIQPRWPSKIILNIWKCSFQHSLAPAISSGVTDFYLWSIYINNCNFVNNNKNKGHGAVIQLSQNLPVSNLKINNCNFSNNGAAKSVIYIHRIHSFVLDHSNFHNNQGVPIYLSNYADLRISGNVLFENNVAENGAGIYISDYSSVIFDKNSIVKFNNNKATNGTIYSKVNSNITFTANSEVTFYSNSAAQYGSAIYSFHNSHVTFTKNSKVTFSNNNVSLSDTNHQFGGTIYSEIYSDVIFKKKSTIVFNGNIANLGSAILSFNNSNIIFKDSSQIMFNSNIAQYCGTLTSSLFSSIIFKGNTKVAYINNTISCANRYYESSGGAICTFTNTDINFSGHSLVTFISNEADKGGALALSETNVIIQKYSTVIFNNNSALYSSGGAFICSNNSSVTIKGNSNVTFNSNRANQNGGAIHSYNTCQIVFKKNSTSKFVNNNARSNGGAIFNSQQLQITFKGSSLVTFEHNTADNGGTFYCTNSTITFAESSMISFYNNKAAKSGGVGYFNLNSKVTFEGNTTVILDNNRASYGGVILANDYSNITLTGNSVLSFARNSASQSGGAGYFYSHCSFTVKENAIIKFINNKALDGGALCISDNVELIVKGNSTALFYNNLAIVGGGAVKVLNESSLTLKEHSTINLTNNRAQYGGAIFLDTTGMMIKSNGDEEYVKFKRNFARISGSSVYQDVVGSCNSSCLNNNILGISNELIATPPNILKFDDPAICIDNDNDTQCNSYYVQNVMLGSEITLPACVLDYYDKPILDSTQFIIDSETHSNYFITGPRSILISCDTFQGMSIVGNQSLSKSNTNFSINISLNVDHSADWKISVTLIVVLSPCHLGFWQYPESQKCECYNANNIVFCSRNSSTIKRGYWFGNVTGKPTITFCPINYCNFTCCESSNGYYHLSPVRDNQCRSYRSGTACGSCTHGYTLSYDSTECVRVESCTADQKVAVILLTAIYWIVMVTLTFAMMYYKVGIGYLYSITYYYSIVDILLSQTLQASRGLYLTVSIMSSFSKIIPQFLGELCVTTGMSGIDQQFIHYVHPSAVTLILGAITLLARKSQRFSVIISRGIIHVICLLLLLSYTSMASTSLLLIRSLRFHDIDKVYTYLSPDIQYFHGRHLAYGIVALLCIVFIVTGPPLLLTLEPFLNHKINFVKIKPLLDQFQGCYKDKYRCFAGYYMICRLVIIIIVITKSSNNFATSYMLIVVCGVIALIHLIIKPYNSEILNQFDGIILHLIIFVTALPLFDDYESPLVITIAFVLIILPLLKFTAMMLFLHKDDLKKMITHFTLKDQSPSGNNNNDIHNTEAPATVKEFHLIVDDNMRRNAIICDV